MVKRRYSYITTKLTTQGSFLYEKLIVAQLTMNILSDTNVHYVVSNNGPPVPMLTQMNPIHKLPNEFLKIHFNITPLIYMSEWSSSGYKTKNFVCISHLTHTCYVPH